MRAHADVIFDQGEAFHGAQNDRREAGGGQCACAVDPQTLIPRVTFTDQDQREVHAWMPD